MSKLDHSKGAEALTRLTLKVSEGAAAYSQFIISLAVALLLIPIGWTSWNWWSTRKEEKAHLALYWAEKDFIKKRDDFSRAELARELTPEQKKQMPEGQKATGDLEKDFGPDLVKLKEMIAAHPGTRAAAMAALDMAHVLTDYNQLEAALDILRPNALNKRELLYGVTVMKSAALKASKDDHLGALGDYDLVLTNPHQSYFHAEALLRSGLSHESLKNIDQARQLYQQTSEKYPDTSAGQNAQKYLLLLEGKSQLGQS